MSAPLVNLAERYNARLMFEGSKLRWAYRDPHDLRSELYLYSIEKSQAKAA